MQVKKDSFESHIGTWEVVFILPIEYVLIPVPYGLYSDSLVQNKHI